METKKSELFDELSVDETLEIDGGAFPLICLLLPGIIRAIYSIGIGGGIVRPLYGIDVGGGGGGGGIITPMYGINVGS